MLLNFKDDKNDCPCPEEIRDQLLDFHEDLMTHCGKSYYYFYFLYYISFRSIFGKYFYVRNTNQVVYR